MSSIRVPAIALTASANTNGYSIPLCFDEVTRVSIHVEYGAVTGTWAVYGSNDPRAFPGHPDYASADWDDITADFGLTDPAGVAGDETEPYDNCNYDYIRLAYTHTAGTAHVRAWISGR